MSSANSIFENFLFFVIKWLSHVNLIYSIYIMHKSSFNKMSPFLLFHNTLLVVASILSIVPLVIGSILTAHSDRNGLPNPIYAIIALSNGANAVIGLPIMYVCRFYYTPCNPNTPQGSLQPSSTSIVLKLGCSPNSSGPVWSSLLPTSRKGLKFLSPP